MRKTTSGFTIVELLVVVAIIGILTTVSFVSFNSIKANSHDSSRSASIKIISDALEKFYQENGEYPGCAAMSATPSTVTTTTLLGLDPAVLTSPSGVAGTNSILAACADIDINSTGDYAYIGDGSDPCVTGSTCSQYTLKYREEATGSIISIKSRHAPVLTIDQPSAPVVNLTYNNLNGNVTATITPVTDCTGGATPQYQISNRLNDGIWSRYTAWGTTLVASQTTSQGIKYDYKAQARCFVNNASYSVSVASDEETYVRPITTVPTVPTVSYSVPSFTSTIYTWGSSSCPTGTSLKYRYNFHTSYGFDFGWVTTTGTSATFTTSTFNQRYTVDVQAQCFNSFDDGDWNATAGSASYDRPFPTVQVLVVAGGGGGGSSDSDESGGGGGGGGVVFHSAKTVSSQSYSVVVGAGGAGGTNGDGNATDGGNSSFWDIVAQGGGEGGYTNEGGDDGGSGGGGAGAMDGSTNSWGNSTQGSSGGGTGYGQHGGLGQWRSDGKSGGGGGGAGQVGGNAKEPITGGGKMVGGYGFYSTITGSGAYYAGGGGGGSIAYWGAGGLGGGGNGAKNGTGANGMTNTGGGGGGGANGGSGGSGIVIVRYPTAALGATGGSSYVSGSETVHVFTSNGTFQVY